MTDTYSKTYRHKVSEFEKRINSFRMFPCKISRITEDVIRIKDAMKDADNFYMSMSQDLKEKEVNTFKKSNELIKKYHMIMRNIDNVCECRPSPP